MYLHQVLSIMFIAMRSRSKPRICPNCGSGKVLPIVYGYPGPEMMEEYDDEKILLGGCCITGDDPEWGCADCDHLWGKLEFGRW